MSSFANCVSKYIHRAFLVHLPTCMLYVTIPQHIIWQQHRNTKTCTTWMLPRNAIPISYQGLVWWWPPTSFFGNLLDLPYFPPAEIRPFAVLYNFSTMISDIADFIIVSVSEIPAVVSWTLCRSHKEPFQSYLRLSTLTLSLTLVFLLIRYAYLRDSI